MLNRGFTSHSQIILSLLYNAKFFDFYFLLKTKVLTSGYFFVEFIKLQKIMGESKLFSIYIALDFPMLLCNNNTFNFVSQPVFNIRHSLYTTKKKGLLIIARTKIFCACADLLMLKK